MSDVPPRQSNWGVTLVVLLSCVILISIGIYVYVTRGSGSGSPSTPPSKPVVPSSKPIPPPSSKPIPSSKPVPSSNPPPSSKPVPSSLPPPPPPPKCDPTTLNCQKNDFYSMCDATGKPTCVQCSDFKTFDSSSCASSEYAKCVNGKTQCVKCSGADTLQCGLYRYEKCSPDGSSLACATCSDYNPTMCKNDNEYAQCENGKTVCKLCQDFESVVCVNPMTHAKCQSFDGRTYKTTCVSE